MANKPKYLLDTVSFLWIIEGDPRLSKKVREALLSDAVTRYLSHVSLIEIAIKYRLGKLRLSGRPHVVIEAECAARDITLLPLDTQSIFHLEKLPQHHRDPFDRLLVCQSLAHGLTFITPDKHLRKYKIKTLW